MDVREATLQPQRPDDLVLIEHPRSPLARASAADSNRAVSRLDRASATLRQLVKIAIRPPGVSTRVI